MIGSRFWIALGVEVIDTGGDDPGENCYQDRQAEEDREGAGELKSFLLLSRTFALFLFTFFRLLLLRLCRLTSSWSLHVC